MKQKLLFLSCLFIAHLASAQVFPDTFEFRGTHASATNVASTVGTPPGPEPAGLNTTGVPSPSGRLSAPVFVDLDDDGDMDMVTGAQTSTGNLYYFQNTGTATDPNWVQTALPSLDAIVYGAGGNNETKCGFADMDDDGDYDLFVAAARDINGSDLNDIHYYENTGTATVPNFVETTFTGLVFQNMNRFPSVGLVDIDNDEDYDLVSVGSDSVSYLENTGTKLVPMFERKFDLENPWDLDAGIFDRDWPHGDVLATASQFVDVDNDGDMDMCLGRDTGTVAWIENIGTASVPDFGTYAYQTFPGDLELYDVGQFSNVFFADVTNDGVLDAITGAFNPGYFTWFEGVLDNPLSIEEENLAINIQVSPNPVEDILTIQFESNQINKTNITMYTITGQMVYGSNKLIQNNRNVKIDVSQLQSGLYFLKIKSDGNKTVVKKITVK